MRFGRIRDASLWLSSRNERMLEAKGRLRRLELIGRRDPGEHIDVPVVDDMRRHRHDIAEPLHRALAGADVGVQPVQ